ncbi:ankyrin repeat domain protein-like protein, partial [Leptotrombidium deliense]
MNIDFKFPGDKALVESKMDLLEACRLNNLEKVQQFINEGANVNITDVNNGENVLHVSVGGSLRLFQFLLEKGSSVHAVDFFGNTLLHAIFGRLTYLQKQRGLSDKEMGNFEAFVSKCISVGIDVNKKNKFQVAPIHIAASNDLISCTRILLAQQNIDVNIQDGEGNTALHRCAQVNNKVILNELIVKGADINKENMYNLTPFEVALKANPVSFDCINVFVSKGIDVRHRISEKRLHDFAISFIPDNKYYINLQNDEGDTAAHLAAKNGELDILDAIIKQHADLRIVNNHDRTILDLS